MLLNQSDVGEQEMFSETLLNILLTSKIHIQVFILLYFIYLRL